MASAQIVQNGSGKDVLMVISEKQSPGEDDKSFTEAPQDVEAQEKQQKQQQCDTNNSNNGHQLIDQQHFLDVDCERLLRNAKKQVKQMMEEAVTKKFIHEGSSSIIALCVSIDACLSHGLKRRALGLFKTNSSTALVQKIAKSCPSASEVLQMVGEEERRQAEELRQLRKVDNMNNNNNNNNNNNSIGANGCTNSAPGVQQQFQQQQKVASNVNVHRRNLWIKCALMERKLVAIVEHLAENASKYYEPEALMANCVSGQLLCSLLVGPCALEFSRSKTNDYYQFEEPSADELLKRHKLSNPIACLCTSTTTTTTEQAANDQHMNQHNCVSETMSRAQSVRRKHSTTSRARRRGESNGEASESGDNCAWYEQQNITPQNNGITSTHDALESDSPPLVRKDSRRRPLALKTNFMTGALVTDCHHYNCQEISEHQHTRGYSFKSKSSNLSATTVGQPSPTTTTSTSTSSSSGPVAATICTQQAPESAYRWPAWSPRVLHETLHQNSKSSLLYAKNNVLLETQAHGTMAGYLSLHQTAIDLILKWTPNQLINGGQQQQQPPRPCQSVSVEVSKAVVSSSQDLGSQRAHSLDNAAAAAERQQRRKKSASDADLGQRARRLSSNVTNLYECTTGTNNKLVQSQAAVGSSYLDLVISMSVSRIVLLHCHFSGHCAHNEDLGNSIQLEQQQHVDAASEETLILVEADGVQRAPFKFPKGGLRWFLSCLETGLAPDRYLEPALKLDSGNGNNIDDPLASIHNWTPMDSPVATSTTNTSEPLLDALLRRLPSLRRRSTNENNNNNNNNKTSTSQSNSRTASPAPSELPARPLNYVFRIVSAGGLASAPPLSALSVASSSSGGGGGSFTLFNSSHGALAKTPSKQLSDPTSLKFSRWSLSRLSTRFSSRTSTSSGAACSSSSVCGQPASNQSLSSFGAESLEGGGGGGGGGGGNGNCCASSSSSTSTTATNSTAQPTASNLMKRDSSSELIRIESKLSECLKKTSHEELMALKNHSIQTLCETMRKQILARAFYGWLAHCRRRKIIRTHLMKLIKIDNNNNSNDDLYLIDELETPELMEEARQGLTRERWQEIKSAASELKSGEARELECKFHQLVYYGGVQDNQLRVEVWPYLLGHHQLGDSSKQLEARQVAGKLAYEASGRQWIKIERVIKRRDQEILAANMAKVAARKGGQQEDSKFEAPPSDASQVDDAETESSGGEQDDESEDDDDDDDNEHNSEIDELEGEEAENEVLSNDNQDENSNKSQAEPTTTTSVKPKDKSTQLQRRRLQHNSRPQRRRFRLESTGSVDSNASITDQFGNNIHRIDKDVQRCDRNFWYFKEVDNLDKLRNIMCTYVWQHLDVGYVQGMCDLAAPFLVIFDDEIAAYQCFNQLMKRMVANFPHGSAMDQHFESLKYLMQVLDPKLFEVLQNNGDYTHFYFCYRWLLLDFKRELAYEDVYRVWETIWSARHVATYHFVVFLALAMVRYYRDIIIENNMDFTDTIKFFNEMAERHDVKRIITLAQDSIVELEALIKD